MTPNHGRLDIMETVESVERVTVDVTEYKRLVDVCVAADVFLRNETPETLDELRDAVWQRTGIID